MQARIHADLVLKALLMAVWRRKPKPGLVIHSDQGSQYTGHEWQKFIKEHELERIDRFDNRGLFEPIEKRATRGF